MSRDPLIPMPADSYVATYLITLLGSSILLTSDRPRLGSGYHLLALAFPVMFVAIVALFSWLNRTSEYRKCVTRLRVGLRLVPRLAA